MRISFANKDKRFNFLYFIFLFVSLLLISYPSFSFPPLSDCWERLYFFHHLNELPGPIKWLHILNHDPNEHMRYQPLSRVFFYALHTLFGSHFISFNILNFLFYFCSILLFYKFSLFFCNNKIISASFTFLFAFLFGHFDILLWSDHNYIIAGFCMFLLGFMSYIKFIKTGRPIFLFWMALLFLLGLWCYESYFLWPLGIIILSQIKSLKNNEGYRKRDVIKVHSIALGLIYALYFLFYLFTRTLGTYEKPTHEFSEFLKLSDYLVTVFLVLFNILYNNIVVNFFPLLPFPCNVTENIYKGGPLLNYIERGNHWVIFVFGGVAGLLLITFFAFLYRKKYIEELKIISFFVFLMLSEPYITFFCRTALNNAFVYSLTEFRYQYTPNAFVILTAIFLIGRFVKLSTQRKKIMFFLLTPVLIFNIFCIKIMTNIYTYHFANLNKMLDSIKVGIQKGYIDKEAKIYIDDNMPDYFPHLCWNIFMGEQFIPKGNYQWMFSKKETGYFAENLNDATWVVDKENFSVKKKSQADIFKEPKKINTINDKWYRGLGKDRKYLEVGFLYRDRARYAEAIPMFEKAIEMEPKNQEAYTALAECYKFQGRYKEAEEILVRYREIFKE